MSRAKWGPSIKDAEKWAFGPGDIVACSYTRPQPRCSAKGEVELDDHGRCQSLLSQPFTGGVISRVASPPDVMFANVFADGTPAPPSPKVKCYVVRVLPDDSVQPPGFFNWNLGAHFLIRSDMISQTNKEKRISDLALWDHDLGIFATQRVSELRNKVHEDNMRERKGDYSDGR